MASSTPQECELARGPEAPPLPARLKHYLLAMPPDKRYRDWAEEDLTSLFSIFRGLVPMMMGYVIGGVVASVFLPWNNSGFFVGSFIGIFIAASLLTVVSPWRRWMQHRKLDAYEKRWAKRFG